jgi:hypothetical protein
MKNKRYLNVRAATKNLKKDILLRHIKTVHEKLKTFECQICKKMFGRKCDIRKKPWSAEPR